VPFSRHVTVVALDNELCSWEGVVIARMIHVKMRADEQIDVLTLRLG
jgi:hypothetical protein